MKKKPQLRPLPFQVQANTPEFWAFTAETLRLAAEILWKKQEAAWTLIITRSEKLKTSARACELSLHGNAFVPAMPLMGFAIENLLKAILIRRGKVKATKKGIDWGGGDGHDQVGLAQFAGEYTRSRSKLLAELTEWVRWTGRYPVPKKEQDRRPPTASRRTWDAATHLYEELRQPAFNMYNPKKII